MFLLGMLMLVFFIPVRSSAQSCEKVMTDAQNDVSSIFSGNVDEPDLDIKEGYASQDDESVVVSMVVFGSIRSENSGLVATYYFINISNLDNANRWCNATWCAGAVWLANDSVEYMPGSAVVDANNLTITFPKAYIGGALRVKIHFETQRFNLMEYYYDMASSGTYILTTPSVPDFSISSNVTSASVVVGGSAEYNISISGSGGFASTVTLSMNGLDSSLTAAFSKATLHPGECSILTVATSKTGNFQVNVTGISGELSHSISLVCSVVNESDFSLNCSDASKTIAQGGTGQFVVNILQLNGFSSAVTFGYSGLAYGLNCSLSSASCTPPCSLVVGIAVEPQVAPGSYGFVLNANGGGRAHSILLSVTVAVPPTELALSKPTFDPPGIVPNGTSVRITTTVTNVGNYTAQGIVVEYYLSSPETGTLLGKDSALPSIAKGACANSSLTYVFSTMESSRSIEIYVRTNSSAGEAIQKASFTLANAVVDVLDLSYKGRLEAGERLDIVVNVRNSGLVPAKMVKVDISSSGAGGDRNDTKVLTELAPGGTREVEFELTLYEGRMALEASIASSYGYIAGGALEKVIVVSPKPNILPFALASALFVGAPICALAFYIHKKRMRIVEDIYLIYNDGRLITHFTRRLDTVDNEVLSAMLTALQDFAKDSFQNKAQGGLDEFKYGELHFIIERGRYVVLAVGVKGESNKGLKSAMRDAVRLVELECSNELSSWSGHMGELARTKPILQNKLSKYTEPSAFR